MRDSPSDNKYLAAAERWLNEFGRALETGDGLEALFHSQSHWRDLLALTWEIGALKGAGEIACALQKHQAERPAGNFRLDAARTPPRRVTRAGHEAIEAIFAFDAAHGRGEGVLRLLPDDTESGTLKAWTLMTGLAELAGFPEPIGNNRPTGDSYSREFHGPNWLDQRNVAVAYADHDPSVLVVGGGQSGLSVAARLGALGVDTLIVDRFPRIGDMWRTRYHALTLHNQVHVNHLPYMPFPPTWPTYIPKDKLAGWFEAYVEALELNYWPGTEFLGGAYDETAGRWEVSLRRGDGKIRKMRPRHVVMATGVSGIANRPKIAGLDKFAGPVIHSGEYEDGEAWRGKRAIIIGTGNSGHDIAQDLFESGAAATLAQRSSTLIIEIEPSAQLPYALYEEGPPIEDCDLLVSGTPFAVARDAHVQLAKRAAEIDKPLLDRLRAVGFKLDLGVDDTGWQFKYLIQGGGYYFNVGCSDLIAERKVGLVQFDDIAEFTEAGARLKSGERLDADLIVLATGYKGQEALVGKLFGDDVAERVGPIWGFGEEEELRNMFRRTAQPGLWFIAGGLAQCRIYSKYLALQIKASEEGLLPPVAQADS
jgi:cation diffusion facilitator CzcD-associated flavoprotein CzcO